MRKTIGTEFMRVSAGDSGRREACGCDVRHLGGNASGDIVVNLCQEHRETRTEASARALREVRDVVWDGIDDIRNSLIAAEEKLSELNRMVEEMLDE